jgi:hypothetical protein
MQEYEEKRKRDKEEQEERRKRDKAKRETEEQFGEELEKIKMEQQLTEARSARDTSNHEEGNPNETIHSTKDHKHHSAATANRRSSSRTNTTTSEETGEDSMLLLPKGKLFHYFASVLAIETCS